ncbi:MAG TPA: hypothetical protein VHZ07_23125 [Bryobacteraceae bacterium]|jgi:hypothetical protein|nr:hypothetical protein [Bryobacteraceae bacterium]
MKDLASALQSELDQARGELEKATAKQLKINAEVEQWKSEVEALQKLLDIRQRRLNPSPESNGTMAVAPEPVANSHLNSTGHNGSDLFSLEDSNGTDPVEQKSKAAWILERVKNSSTHGCTAAEVAKLASESGIEMHPNYPYTVLKSYVKRGKVNKRGVRYYYAN